MTEQKTKAAAVLGTDYPRHFECRLCGGKLTLTHPWEGRPQGPQCQCNPGTWGNWKRVQVPNAKVSEGENER